MTVTLYNARARESRVIDAILNAKGVQHENKQAPCAHSLNFWPDEPTLVDNGHVVEGTVVIALYLEQRYPSPALLPADPVNSSVVMMIFRNLLAQTIDFSDYKDHLLAHGFIIPDRPSFVDVALSVFCPDEPFWNRWKDRLESTYGSWDD